MTQHRSKWFDEEVWRRPDHWSNAQLGGFPIILLVLIVSVVGAVVAARYESAKVEAKSKGDSMGSSAISSAGQIAVRDLQWAKDGFGSVMVIHSVDIVNRNDYPTKDFLLRCVLFAPSGTIIGSVNHTIFERVAANTSETFRHINLGFINSQAERANCGVIHAARAK